MDDASTTPPAIFIVDDDFALRDSLIQVLRPENKPVVTFAGAADFLESTAWEQPGCLLLDVRLPGMSGLELQYRLQVRGCRLPVLFMTAHGDVPMAIRAMKAGAFDFLEKPFPAAILRRRVREALALDQRRRRIDRHTRAVATRLEQLSAGEYAVLERVAVGQYNKVIATELGLCLSTVELYRKRAMDKLGLRSLTDLVRLLAWQERLPELRATVEESQLD